MTSPAPAGVPKHTNALAHETSPYLLQHAHNPVQWHPWGPAAFALARQQNKPIFLSIGYSTCHWCHVMERQCFENEAIAALMNELFINIKVDREERPDVDDVYMAAVQLLTRSGGWPMSVWLTPPGSADAADQGLKPFYAGTYFPPTEMHGRPSFPRVLQALGDAWRDRRPEVIDQANQIAASVANHLQLEIASPQPEEIGGETISKAVNHLLRTYDETHGGFGNAPKFPQPANLALLLAVHANNQSDKLRQALQHTLDRMARGGMYDQVGGGFHRYSTDEKWLVPHFEKMLYDNGQLAEVYLQAHQQMPLESDPDFFAHVARDICDYVLREMTDATGAFWSAQDAEVDAREGGNYLWLPPQVRDALQDETLAELALTLYGLNAGTNFQDPHHLDEQPQNVLFVPHPWAEMAQQFELSLPELRAQAQQINAKLLAVRDTRKQPGTDDKVLASWNGMMIAGLAQTGRVLDEPRYVTAAARAADALLTHLRAADGSLLRTMRNGQARIAGFLEDYAFVAHGLLALHQATDDNRWLVEAARLMGLAVERFAAPQGGYFDTLADQPDLLVRPRGTYDGAIPSGNSQMVHNLLTLHQRTGDERWLQRAIGDLHSFARNLAVQSVALVHMQHALLRALQQSDKLHCGIPATAGARPTTRREVVSVSVSPETITLGAQPTELIVTLRVGPEYHLNGPAADAEGLIPTTLRLEGQGAALTVDYPAPTMQTFPLSEKPLAVYVGEIKLRAQVRQTGPITTPPTLVLRYQVCTDQSCLEPREVELPVRLTAAK